MRFTINQMEMASALSIPVSIAEGNSVSNLAAIRIETVEGMACFQATDQREVVYQYAMALVSEAGSVCVPARMLGSVIKSMPDEAIEVYTEGNILHIKGKKNHLTLPTNDSYELVAMKDLANVEKISVNAEKFVDAVKRVSTFADRDEKESYPGVYLDAKDGVLNVVGTNGIKVANIAFSDKTYPDVSAFIPIFFVKHLSMLKGPGDIEIEISTVPKAATFHLGDTILQTTLLGKEFPNWRYVMTLPESSSITCNLAALKSCIGRCAAIGANVTEFTFTDEVGVAGYGNNGSSSVDTVAAESSTIEGTAESYVATTLMQSVLASMSGAEMTIEVYLANKPLILHDADMTALVMPMRKPTR